MHPPADIGFVDFDGAIKQRLLAVVLSHREADAMHEEQGALIAQARHALDLHGRNAFLRGARGPEGVTPVAKWNPRILENGAYPNGVLTMASVALPKKALAPLA